MDFAPRKRAEQKSHGDQPHDRQPHKAVLVVNHCREDADRRNHHGQARALGFHLAEAEQQHQARHEHHASADAQHAAEDSHHDPKANERQRHHHANTPAPVTDPGINSWRGPIDFF